MQSRPKRATEIEHSLCWKFTDPGIKAPTSLSNFQYLRSYFPEQSSKHDLCTGFITGSPSSQREELYCFFFFYSFANAQRNVTSGIYHYTTIEFDFAKRDSRLAAYGGVVLQRFEFIKVCMGSQRFCWKTQFCLYFANKIYLPCCCVVFFSVCQLLRSI